MMIDLERLKQECERTTPSGGWDYVLDRVPELIEEVERLQAMMGDAYYAGAANAESAFAQYGTFSDLVPYATWLARQALDKPE